MLYLIFYINLQFFIVFYKSLKNLTTKTLSVFLSRYKREFIIINLDNNYLVLSANFYKIILKLFVYNSMCKKKTGSYIVDSFNGQLVINSFLILLDYNRDKNRILNYINKLLLKND